ncbi:MAG: Pr6Pr family membrane protein [Clostridia bacterium]|nr:Pr6Pr family membrane protein [Clostridia bacterium]
MLAIAQKAPLGAILSALIVAASLAGLTMHGDFYAGICRRDYWAYYTNQSNLLVFVYFALVAPLLYSAAHLQTLIPHAEFAVMLCIMLTHLIFHHFLAPFVLEETIYTPHAPDLRIARADSIVQHYAVPLLTLAYWLLCSPGKNQLGLFDVVLWLAFPSAYVLYVFIRARLRGRISKTQSAYPYPFLDVDFFGWKRVCRLIGVLLSLCLGASLALVGFIRLFCALFCRLSGG